MPVDDDCNATIIFRLLIVILDIDMIAFVFSFIISLYIILY